MDITELILEQHHEQRRTFAMLDDLPVHDTAALAAVWARLDALLEVHADAEERFFYPRLLQVGKGLDADGPDDEVQDAISDHNDIRDAIRRVRAAETGSATWWEALRVCRQNNSDHMAEEEREDLADFRRHADLQTRHDVAVAFLTYQSQHAQGVAPVDQDPDEYVRSGHSAG